MDAPRPVGCSRAQPQARPPAALPMLNSGSLHAPQLRPHQYSLKRSSWPVQGMRWTAKRAAERNRHIERRRGRRWGGGTVHAPRGCQRAAAALCISILLARPARRHGAAAALPLEAPPQMATPRRPPRPQPSSIGHPGSLLLHARVVTGGTTAWASGTRGAPTARSAKRISWVLIVGPLMLGGRGQGGWSRIMAAWQRTLIAPSPHAAVGRGYCHLWHAAARLLHLGGLFQCPATVVIVFHQQAHLLGSQGARPAQPACLH